MSESPNDLLLQVARIPEAERHERRAELLRTYTPQLSMPLHRQILDCLVGEPCTSLVAQSWASALSREKSTDGFPEHA